MIKKIILKDFLAHADTTIELGEGMTVLTGPNNSGKSSIVEALRCIATNPPPKYFIRHGAKKARVELEMDDGVRVAWIRKKATAWYEVTKPGAEEPEVYAKFGRKTPEDVLNLLRLNQVPLEGGNSLDVHIGNQRNPIFLLDQPASVAAQFFASSSEASHLLAMQTELKNRVRAAKREKKFQQNKMVQISEELDGLQELPAVNMELDAARELKEQTDKVAGEIPAIENLLDRKAELEKVQKNLAERGVGLEELHEGPELYPTAPLEAVAVRMQSLRGHGNNLNKRAQSLEGIKNPPELFPVQHLDADISRQKQLSAAGRIQATRRNVLEPLCSPPDLTDVSALSAMVSNVSRNHHFRENIATRADILTPLAIPPELFDGSQLMQTVTNISSLKQSQAQMQNRLIELDESGRQLKERIERRLEEIGNCPLCGGELEAEKLIGEAVHES